MFGLDGHGSGCGVLERAVELGQVLGKNPNMELAKSGRGEAKLAPRDGVALKLTRVAERAKEAFQVLDELKILARIDQIHPDIVVIHA